MAEPPRITDAMIARRAFELSLTDASSTPEESRERARRELEEEAARQAEEGRSPGLGDG